MSVLSHRELNVLFTLTFLLLTSPFLMSFVTILKWLSGLPASPIWPFAFILTMPRWNKFSSANWLWCFVLSNVDREGRIFLALVSWSAVLGQFHHKTEPYNFAEDTNLSLPPLSYPVGKRLETQTKLPGLGSSLDQGPSSSSCVESRTAHCSHSHSTPCLNRFLRGTLTSHLVGIN